MNDIYIKPNTGPDGKPFKVRLPDKPHMFLPDDGADVPLNTYWLRRLRDESVVEAKRPAKPKAIKE